MSIVAWNALAIMSRPYLGDFERLVLLAVMRLADAGYGLAIWDEIVQRTARDVSTEPCTPRWIGSNAKAS